MYLVLKNFTDLQDQGHFYRAGDIFPRDGLKVNRKRLSELSSTKNRQKIPLIEKVSNDANREKSEDNALNENAEIVKDDI